LALLKSKLSNNPVGIFDSGLGGLSVLRHIQEQLPNESLCYFADSGFAPYGDKTEEEIIERTLFAARYLLQQGVKAIVVACNTATAITIKLIRAHYPDLVLVGVEPGLKPAASLSNNGCIGVLATSRTLASIKYQRLCEQIQQNMSVRFINQACPGLVTQIELGELESETTLQLLNNYLQPIFAAQADTLVLGCTHYPFVEDSIKRIASKESQLPIQLVDTGAAIARQLKRLLEERQLINQQKTPAPIHFTTSGDTKQLQFSLGHLLHLQPENYIIHQSTPEK
jgi:glutamate racemase